LLKTLPEYQKKTVMLDALCQSIEAYWSKNRTFLSKQYSKHSIELILNNYKEYLNNNPVALKNVQLAANLSGKAITLSKTCAPHAMCYRMTTKYNIAHGHAVVLTLIKHWRLINERKDQETTKMLLELANIIGFDNIEQSINHIENIIKEINLPTIIVPETDIEYLTAGVDMKRLYNHPIELTKEDIKNIYSSINNIMI
jgi:alcohol dehydrogenase class IV